jgi:putative peptidoglycan lipid II flippase
VPIARSVIRAWITRLETTRAAALVRRFLPTGAVTLSALMFGGYLMGLARDRVTAHTFGLGPAMDAYNAAFILPELGLDVLVAGGLVAPFVPMFLGLRDEAAADADRFARTVLSLAAASMTAVSALLFVLAPATVEVIVPGFTNANKELYVGLFRVMCLTPPLFAVSLVLGEVLVAQRRFAWYGLAPMMYSGGIAAGSLLLSGSIGVYGAAWGAVAGAAGHLLIRLVGLRGSGFRPLPGFSPKTRGLGQFLRLMFPKMASQPLEPLVYLFYTSIASGLVVGSISSLNYARNFFGVPVSMIGMAFAIAALPGLSEAANAGDRAAFARLFRRTLLSTAALSAAAGAALFVFSGLVISVFLGGGKMEPDDQARTALVLSVYAFAVPVESVMNLLARAVYATKNTLLPTLAALTGFTVVVVTVRAWLPDLGLAAIPASYAAGMGARTLLLVAALAIRATTIRPAALVDGDAFARFVHGSPGAARRRTSATAQGALIVLTVVVLAGTALATSQALSSASIVAAPVVTPWAQELPLASHNVPTLPPTPGATAVATASPAAGPSGSPKPGKTPKPTPTPTPKPTPKPGPFQMDLYEKGDYVGEYDHLWCVPAAIQTSINIMSNGADTSRAYQTKLFNLAYSMEPASDGSVDAIAWPEVLTKLGYGKYEQDMRGSINAAVWTVVKAIRLTNRPGGLVVWHGWHSWVVSGFKATADPAATNDYTVLGLYIEDVWYPRLSSIWGYSNPPDTYVPVSDLDIDYKTYHENTADPVRDGKYVFVVPVP